MKRLGILGLVSGALMGGSALAEEAKPATFTPGVVATADVFASYANNLQSGDKAASAFELSRIYFGAKAKLTPRVSAVLTLDAGRYGAYSVSVPTYSIDADGNLQATEGSPVVYDGGSNRLNVFIKKAYLETADLFGVGLKLQAGMVSTAWPGYEEGIWGHRYVAQTYGDLWKLLNTADIGVSLLGNHLGGIVDYQVSVVNGEGYKKPELSQHQQVQARLTLAPLAKLDALKGLKLAGYVDYGALDNDGHSKLTAIGNLSFEHRYVTVSAGYITQNAKDVTSGGLTAFLVVHPMADSHVLVRFDRFDADAGKDNDGVNLLIVGLSHDFLKGFSTALDFQMKSYEDTAKESDRIVALHTRFSF